MSASTREPEAETPMRAIVSEFELQRPLLIRSRSTEDIS
jgi:hypothetical protein